MYYLQNPVKILTNKTMYTMDYFLHIRSR